MGGWNSHVRIGEPKESQNQSRETTLDPREPQERAKTAISLYCSQNEGQPMKGIYKEIRIC